MLNDVAIPIQEQPHTDNIAKVFNEKYEEILFKADKSTPRQQYYAFYKAGWQQSQQPDSNLKLQIQSQQYKIDELEQKVKEANWEWYDDHIKQHNRATILKFTKYESQIAALQSQQPEHTQSEIITGYIHKIDGLMETNRKLGERLQSQQPEITIESEDELWSEVISHRLIMCDYVDRVIGELKKQFTIKRK